VISKGEYGEFYIQNLNVGEGVGYRPVTDKNKYSVTSVGIDTLFFYRHKDKKLKLVTFDYSLGENSVYKTKLKKNKYIYDTFFLDKNYFNVSFAENYTHYLLVLDEQFKDIEKKIIIT